MFIICTHINIYISIYIYIYIKMICGMKQNNFASVIGASEAASAYSAQKPVLSKNPNFKKTKYLIFGFLEIWVFFESTGF